MMRHCIPITVPMAGLKDYFHLCGICILTITINSAMALKPSCDAVVKGAYWPEWASSSFPPSAIDTRLFTHLYYAFLIPNNATFRFEVSNSTAMMLSMFTSTIHAKNPPARTLFSVSGGDTGAALFSQMASTNLTRKSFIDSSIEVARKFCFDGVDLDWEFPQDSNDMINFGHLLHEWRAAVQKEAKASYRIPLLLTAATYFSIDFFLDPVQRSYPVDSITKNLDWINAMCYDYYGSWDTTKTGAPAALFDPKSNISTSYGLRSWINAGLPPSKLILGLPLYGHTWKLEDSRYHGIEAPAVGLGPGDEGTMTYSQVEKFNRDNNATVVYDVDSVSTYSFTTSSWIGYDDTRSIMVKVDYARTLGLRGYFFWSVNDDYEWKLSREASRLWIL